MSDRKWYRIVNKAPEIAEVCIYDEIGAWGVTAKNFVSDFNAITAKQITLRINSVGGEVFDGLAIYNAIQQHPSTVNVEIDGIAASISAVIACAGDSVCIAKNAFMMIHNVMNGCFGYAEDLRKQADVIDKLSLSAAQAFVDRTGKSLQEVQKAMGDESWFDAPEAKAFGLVDSIREEDGDEEEDGGDDEAKASILNAALKFKTAPEKLRTYAAKLSLPPSVRQKKEPFMAALGIISRDGKNFVKVGDTEYEVALTGSAAPAPTNPAPQNAAVDLDKVKADAVKVEREYALSFRTAMAAAGMKDEAADDFEETFYGRPIDDVKFLASNAIGTRAKALGEANGGEGTEKKPEEKSAEELEATATKRFAAELELRKLFGLGPYDDVNSHSYKNALARYIAREKSWAADQAAGKHQKIALSSK